MSERLTTLSLALAALAMFWLLILPKPSPDRGEISEPLSTDRGSDGYLAARRWLEAENVPVRSLHERYGHLGEAGMGPGRGNVLLAVMPQLVPARAQEEVDLDRWLRQGNTLVVLAALDDTPTWTVGLGGVIPAIEKITGLRFDAVPDPDTVVRSPRRGRDESPASAVPLSAVISQAVNGKHDSIEPRGSHPLFEGVRGAQVFSALPASRWLARPADDSALLDIGQIAANGDPAVWLHRRGEGQIIVLGAASPFTNALIGDNDNARLLSNLIAWSRAPRGAVVFDDAHQGALGEYDARRFFRDPRLYWALTWIVLAWLTLLVGIQPLRARVRSWNPIDITAFLGMSGEFLASVSSPKAAGTRLLENFFNGVRRRLNLPEDGAPVWDWLLHQAGVPADEIAELESMHARLVVGRRVDLVRLQTLISQLQGCLV